MGLVPWKDLMNCQRFDVDKFKSETWWPVLLDPCCVVETTRCILLHITLPDLTIMTSHLHFAHRHIECQEMDEWPLARVLIFNFGLILDLQKHSFPHSSWLWQCYICLISATNSHAGKMASANHWTMLSHVASQSTHLKKYPSQGNHSEEGN